MLSIHKKRFIISLLVISYIFYFPVEVKALAGPYALTTGVVVGAEALGEVGTIGVVSTVGSVAIPVVACAVALGVIYYNRYEIANFVTGFYDYMKSRNIDGVKDSSLTQDGKDCLRDYVTGYSTVASTNKIPLISSVTVPANTIVWTSIGVNLDVNPKVTLELYQTGIKHISNVSFAWRIDNYPKIYYGGNTVSFYDGSLRVGSTVVDDTLTCNTVRVGLRNTGDFDTDVGVAQTINPLPKKNTANVTGSYLYPDFSPDGTTYVSPKTDFDYDDFIQLSPDKLPDVVTVSDTAPVPVPNPDPTNPNPDPSTDTTVPDSVPKLDFSPLYQDLSRKFPFCVPFDFVEMIRAFKVKAVAPSFTVDFDSAYFVGGGSFTFTFEKFDKVIKVLRYLMLLGFIVGLIKKTRAWIGNGGAS